MTRSCSNTYTHNPFCMDIGIFNRFLSFLIILRYKLFYWNTVSWNCINFEQKKKLNKSKSVRIKNESHQKCYVTMVTGKYVKSRIQLSYLAIEKLQYSYFYWIVVVVVEFMYRRMETFPIIKAHMSHTITQIINSKEKWEMINVSSVQSFFADLNLKWNKSHTFIHSYVKQLDAWLKFRHIL